MDLQEVPRTAKRQPTRHGSLWAMFHPTTGTELAVLILGVVLVVGMIIVDVVALINPYRFL